MTFAALVVGSLALVAGGIGVGRETSPIQVVKERCEPVRIETFVPVAFAPHSVAAPTVARPKPIVAAAPTPAPPPLPFRYMGRLVEDGKPEVFVLRGEEHFSVAAGDRLGSDYRVEEVTESEIVFLYLPLNIRQRLPL